jgi:hypothetical protein
MAIIIYMVFGAIYSQEKDTVHNSREYTFEESVNQFDIEKAKKTILGEYIGVQIKILLRWKNN